MKGMFDLLERAGLVRRVGDADVAPDESVATAGGHEAEPVSSPAPVQPIEETTGMSLDQVFASAGVAPCAYPAERLLRLLDGLKAMDETTRRQTIQAIDSADDSWSIEDPMRDAAAKVASIERHASSIRAGVAQAEKQAKSRLGDITKKQESTVAEIRRQIADLDGLLAREIARGAQETAALEAEMVARRESANRELGDLSRAAGALNGLIAQFGGNAAR